MILCTPFLIQGYRAFALVGLTLGFAHVDAAGGQMYAVLGGIVAGFASLKLDKNPSAGYRLVTAGLGGAVEFVMNAGDCERQANSRE